MDYFLILMKSVIFEKLDFKAVYRRRLYNDRSENFHYHAHYACALDFSLGPKINACPFFYGTLLSIMMMVRFFTPSSSFFQVSEWQYRMSSLRVERFS